MALIFCPQCGSRAEYQFAPPNFCAKCGVSYQQSHKPAGLLSQRQQKSPRLSSVKQAQANVEDFDDENLDDDDEDEGSSFSDSNRVPRLRGIAVDLDHSSPNRVFKIGDLIQEAEGSAPQFNSSFRPPTRRDINDLSNDRQS